jgi:DNA-binding beta-propeller fold protein YncE
MKTHTRFVVWIACLALFSMAQVAGVAADAAGTGAVYVMSNKTKNSVLVFQRAADGSLTSGQEILTRGAGTGVTLDPLMSQGALSLSPAGNVLLAVNPVSGDLTAFRVTASGLEFGSIVPSGGDFPVSVACNGQLVYVLNQLGTANISGFTVDDSAQLQPLTLSTRDLAGGALALPAQVRFTPDGTQLFVTEKGTNTIDTFTVRSDGRTNGPGIQLSSGRTPFGFAFGPAGSLVVAEVENRLPAKATTSSYLVNSGGLTPVSPAVPNRQSGSCWVAITGATAWIVNTGTATISAYQIGAGGNLLLVDADAAFTGDATSPIDLAATSDNQFLYVIKSATGEIAAFKINGTTLTPLFTQPGLPLSIQGIVAN